MSTPPSVDDTVEEFYLAADTEAIDLDAGDVQALSQADRHLGAMAAIDREIATVTALYAVEFERLTARRDARVAILVRAREWHEAPCLQLAAALLARDPRWRSQELPHGTLKAVVGKTYGVGYPDEKAFIAWAEDNQWPENLVRYKVEIERNAVKKAFTVREVTCPACDGVGNLQVVGPETYPLQPLCEACTGVGEVPRWVSAAGEVVPGIIPTPPATTYRAVVA